jgi:hypothetical protein
MRVEEADASVDAFASVSADFGGLPRFFVKQVSVVCLRRWP